MPHHTAASSSGEPSDFAICPGLGRSPGRWIRPSPRRSPPPAPAACVPPSRSPVDLQARRFSGCQYRRPVGPPPRPLYSRRDLSQRPGSRPHPPVCGEIYEESICSIRLRRPSAALAAGPPPPPRPESGRPPSRRPASSSTTPRSACSTSRSRPAGPRWVQENFITYDTQILAAARNEVAHRRRRRARQAGDPLRRGPAPTPTCGARWSCSSAAWCCRRPPIPSQERRAVPPRRLARRPVRLRQVLPAGRRRVQEPPRPRGHHAQQPRPQGAARRLDRLAHDLAADARRLRAAGRDRQRGRPRAGLQGHRRPLARQVRHAAGRLRRRARPALGPGQAALRLAPLLRAGPAQQEVRRRRGAARRAHPGAPAGQHVGAGVGQHLRRGGARPTPTPATT